MTSKFDIIKLKAQVALGNAESMFILGNNYLYGIGVDVDFKQAHKLIKQAAEKGFEPAMGSLEYSFADKGRLSDLSDELKDIYESVSKIMKDADQGNPVALFIKSKDKIMDADTHEFMFNRGINDMKIAAHQGYPPALYYLGITYLKDNRIKGKQAEGKNMILKSAEEEFLPALMLMMQLGFDLDKVYSTLSKMVEKQDVDEKAYKLLSEFYLEGIHVEQNKQEGLRLLNLAADLGDIDAIYNLGLAYELGKYGIKPDIAKAVSYYEKGVEKKDPDCMNNLGAILEHSESYSRDLNRAFNLYLAASERNHGMAYNNLGTCYKRAKGTEQDKEKALKCYIKATELGVLPAFWNLYLYYMDGVCTPIDFETAVKWLENGDKAGSIDCTYQLSIHYMNGDGVKRDIKKMVQYLQKAANADYNDAFEKLADCYLHGFGIERDPNQAFKWYKKAAEVSVSGIAALGRCYTYAIGTPKNDKKAVELYMIAAKNGDAQAQYDLGICYRQGEGVDQDYNKAIEWYQKAAAQGHGGALNNLGIMYDNGIGVNVDAKKAFDYFRESAEAGNHEGQFCLASMFFNGRGVEQDYKEAVKWFKAAAEQGEPDSMYHLAICYNDGLGVEKNIEKAISYLYAAADRGFQKAIEIIKENNIPRP